ncbi:MAG: hypothetical protein ACM3IL_01715 [Deltaproteobacteria bacterium]
MRKISVFFGAFLVMSFAACAYAQKIPQPFVATTTFSTYINYPYGKENSARENIVYPSFEKKFSEGLIDVATLWVEIPRKVIAESRAEKEPIIFAGTVGFAEGVVSGLERGVVGTYEMATSGVYSNEKPLMNPRYNVEPDPEGFKIEITKW